MFFSFGSLWLLRKMHIPQLATGCWLKTLVVIALVINRFKWNMQTCLQTLATYSVSLSGTLKSAAQTRNREYSPLKGKLCLIAATNISQKAHILH